jgi:hypothetical protein
MKRKTFQDYYDELIVQIFDIMESIEQCKNGANKTRLNGLTAELILKQKIALDFDACR